MPSKQSKPLPDDFDPENDPNWRINERAIVENLRTDERGFTPQQIAFLCNMAILAAHERGVTRVPMTEIINNVNDIRNVLTDIEGAANLMMVYRQMFDHPAEKLMEALDAKAKELTALRYSLAEKVQQLLECRPPGTKLS